MVVVVVMAVVVVVVVIEYTHRASERAAFKNEANLTSKTLSKTREREEKNTESENSTKRFAYADL